MNNLTAPKIQDQEESSVDTEELMCKVDLFVREHGIERILLGNCYALDPQKYLWIDMYPYPAPMPDCQTDQMLNDWRKLERDQVVFLYFHFPFCAKRCEFCYYHISTSQREMPSYLNLMEKEARAFLEHLSPGSSVGDVYFGGGTPSIVPPDELKRFYDIIFEYVDRERIDEVNLELHPATMRKDLHLLAESGHIDRVSMGVQSFNSTLIDANGRITFGFDKLCRICDKFKTSGIQRIGMDFMVGLHDQSEKTVAGDIACIDRLIKKGFLNSVSVYPRSFTDNSLPLEKEKINGEILLSKFRQHMLYRFYFDSIGWKEGPMYLFTPPSFSPAVPSALVNKSSSAQALAFGNSGRSTFDHTNYLNIKSYKDYLVKPTDSVGSTGSYIRLTSSGANRRFLQYAAKRGDYDLDHLPMPFSELDAQRLEHIHNKLVDDGLLSIDGSLVKVTELGKLLIEVIHRQYESTFRTEEEAIVGASVGWS